MSPISLTSPAASSFTPALGGDDMQGLHGKKPGEVAQQFESLFVSMLVKEMRQSSQDGEGMFPGDSSDTFGGMFDMYMGQHLAQHGGIGLSQSINAAIQKQAGLSATGAA